jgi:hypothetical protein
LVRTDLSNTINARLIAERARQSADDAASNLEKNLSSLQREKERFERDEKAALAAFGKSHGGILKPLKFFIG